MRVYLSDIGLTSIIYQQLKRLNNKTHHFCEEMGKGSQYCLIEIQVTNKYSPPKR